MIRGGPMEGKFLLGLDNRNYMEDPFLDRGHLVWPVWHGRVEAL